MYYTISDGNCDIHESSASASYFSPGTIRAIFQALDVNEDGYLCAKDLDCWSKQERSASTGSKNGCGR